jgi:hypothetical protein
MEKAEPDSLRQSAQWQASCNLGSALISYLTCPHRQPPVILSAIFLLHDIQDTSHLRNFFAIVEAAPRSPSRRDRDRPSGNGGF